MTGTFNYLVRFVDQEGSVEYGNVPEEKRAETLLGTPISLLSGNPFTGLKVTNQERIVSKVRTRGQTVLHSAQYLISSTFRYSVR
jgi:hypothetical protein